jgi:hypothetical protein
LALHFDFTLAQFPKTLGKLRIFRPSSHQTVEDEAEEVPATSNAEPPAEPEKAVASITIEQADTSP